LADRRKPTARHRTGRVDKHAAGKNSAVTALSLPNIAELIADGEITVGVLRPIGCVATATDGHNCLAMLVRRRRETLFQLLTRLDQAVDKALTEDIYTFSLWGPSPLRSKAGYTYQSTELVLSHPGWPIQMVQKWDSSRQISWLTLMCDEPNTRTKNST